MKEQLKEKNKRIKDFADSLTILTGIMKGFSNLFREKILKKTHLFGVDYTTFKKIRDEKITGIIIMDYLAERQTSYMEFRCGDNVVYRKMHSHEHVSTMNINGKHRIRISGGLGYGVVALGFKTEQELIDATGPSFRGGILQFFIPIPKGEIK